MYNLLYSQCTLGETSHASNGQHQRSDHTHDIHASILVMPNIQAHNIATENGKCNTLFRHSVKTHQAILTSNY